MTQKPLSGYRIIDFTSVVAGPWCTRLLADCGAEVIKIESPGAGDVMRYAPPLAGGESRVYAHFNCGKKNMCLDLKREEGVDIARKLIETADVVVENFRPGVMAKLGLDYASVRGEREDLIYCSVSGFGQTGPMATAPAYAPVLHALSGYDHAQQVAQPQAEGPLSCGIMVADILAATYAFGAIQTAIIQKERFGKGAHLDVSLMDSMLTMVALQTQEAQWHEEIKSTVFHPALCKDGHVIIPLVNHKNYLDLLSAIGETELLQDPRFKTFPSLLDNRTDILQALADWTASRTVAAVVNHMQDSGLPCARFRTAAQTLEDQHLIDRGSFASLNDSVGAFTVVSAPFRADTMDLNAGAFVAKLGQHTDAVLVAGGFDDATIANLRTSKVVA
ncbi:MAG: CoA transferase [Gammaproteobacteria bacterium]|jgi:CoA:oxalate CoA-transferase|nr:CoA transferase [Gammaproteobacteria bacterium]